MSRLADRWRAAIPALVTATLRANFLRSELSRFPLAEVSEALDDIADRTEQADPIARDVLAALVPILSDPDCRAQISAFRAQAQQRNLLPLGRLLRTHSLDPSKAAALDTTMLPTAKDGRALTLGERKALARRPDRFALDRLLRDPDPTVIRNLLSNPRITETDIMRLAARRPNSQLVLYELARHPEWASRARVRLAMVQNPYSPADIALPMLRLLIRPELRQVVQATDVHPVVRAEAIELLNRRPPVPSQGEFAQPKTRQ